MTELIRVPPVEAKQKTTFGSALLICAYDDEQKFKNNHLAGAISMAEFRSKLSILSKDQEVIFYCA